MFFIYGRTPLFYTFKYHKHIDETYNIALVKLQLGQRPGPWPRLALL
jgi:hypothetical protein